MNEKKAISLPFILKLSLDVLIVVGLVVYALAGYNSISTLENIPPLSTAFTFVLFVIGGISLIAILFFLRKVVDSLVKGTPFIWDNVKSLKKISICCFIISFCYIVNILINNQLSNLQIVSLDSEGVHTDIEFLVFFFAGCFILILSQVFKQAVQFKEDNDLTI